MFWQGLRWGSEIGGSISSFCFLLLAKLIKLMRRGWMEWTECLLDAEFSVSPSKASQVAMRKPQMRSFQC